METTPDAREQGRREAEPRAVRPRRLCARTGGRPAAVGVLRHANGAGVST